MKNVFKLSTTYDFELKLLFKSTISQSKTHLI